MQITAIPPMMPPAMAPVCELLPPVGDPPDPVEPVPVEDVALAVTAFDEVEAPISEPGPTSGVSPTAYD